MKQCKLIFANQSVDTKTKYNIVRETKCYYFLEEDTKEFFHTFRVHKNTLNVKGYHKEKQYSFDVPKAISLILI
jgi:YHS domain-containing protein